jgi:hypothetical protein
MLDFLLSHSSYTFTFPAIRKGLHFALKKLKCSPHVSFTKFKSSASCFFYNIGLSAAMWAYDINGVSHTLVTFSPILAVYNITFHF